MGILDKFRLDDEVAIVTGAGRGIGRAISIAFAEAGATVVLASRTEKNLHDTAAIITAAGGKALALPCDVNNATQLQQVIDETLAQFGKITLLVNNAGGALPNNPLETSGEQFDQDYHFNVTTAFNLSRLAVPSMQKNGRGSIINISSAAGRYAQRGFSSYGTAKAALNQLTRLLAADFAPTVRVNAICPGTIMTDALNYFLDADATAKMTELTPMKSLGQPEDIAAAALYLASPAAHWVTGKILEIDGGAESTTWPF